MLSVANKFQILKRLFGLLTEPGQLMNRPFWKYGKVGRSEPIGETIDPSHDLPDWCWEPYKPRNERRSH
jgi:hypothetical protein